MQKIGFLEGFVVGVMVGVVLLVGSLTYKQNEDISHINQKLLVSPTSPLQKYACEVTNVVDGDTIDVDFKVWPDVTLSKRIRFTDIDAWETRGENKEKGKAATLFLINLLEDNQVYLKSNGSTGKYGRTLGSIFIMKDGNLVSISEKMIEAGHQKIIEPVQ